MELINLKQAMEYIHGTNKFGKIPGLSRVSVLLELLGNPQNYLKFVHIAGTNGKGSTASFISSILIDANLKVGIFTSPYIHRFNERIKINNEEISDDDIVKYINIIKEKIDIMVLKGLDSPTEFDILTAMSFMYFLDKRCDIVVLEVGLGGSIDSTNIIPQKEVAIITSISFDHMDYLGNTLEEIAEKKAGIITNDIDVVVYPQMVQVHAVIEKVCRDKNSRKIDIDVFSITDYNVIDGVSIFSYKDLKNLEIRLLGEFQRMNAALAIEACTVLIKKGYPISIENIISGLFKAVWAGRFEIVHSNPIVIIDGAHNQEGAENLVKNLKYISKERKILFITGVLKDKDYEQMFKEFFPISKGFLTITPDNPRALKARELAEYLQNNNQNAIDFENVKSALDKALELTTKEDIICIFGSLYFIGEVRNYFGLQ